MKRLNELPGLIEKSQTEINELKTRIKNHTETSDPCICEAERRHDFTSTYQEDCEPCKQRYKERREFDDMNRQLRRKKGDREALLQEQIILQKDLLPGLGINSLDPEIKDLLEECETKRVWTVVKYDNDALLTRSNTYRIYSNPPIDPPVRTVTRDQLNELLGTRGFTRVSTFQQKLNAKEQTIEGRREIDEMLSPSGVLT